jgi:hypothetical protein
LFFHLASDYVDARWRLKAFFTRSPFPSRGIFLRFLCRVGMKEKN